MICASVKWPTLNLFLLPLEIKLMEFVHKHAFAGFGIARRFSVVSNWFTD